MTYVVRATLWSTALYIVLIAPLVVLLILVGPGHWWTLPVAAVWFIAATLAAPAIGGRLADRHRH